MTPQPDTRTRNLRAATKGALIAEIRRLEEQAVQAEVELADATVAYERGQARAFQAEAELAALIAERDGWRERAEQAEAALLAAPEPKVGEETTSGYLYWWHHVRGRHIRRCRGFVPEESIPAGDNQ